MGCKSSGWPTILLFREHGRHVLTSGHVYSVFIFILQPPLPAQMMLLGLFYLMLPCFKSLHLLLQSISLVSFYFQKFQNTRHLAAETYLFITLRQQEVQALTHGWHLRSTYCEVPIPKLQIPDTNLWQFKWFLNLEEFLRRPGNWGLKLPSMSEKETQNMQQTHLGVY